MPAPDMVPALGRRDPLTAAGVWLNRLSVLLLPLQVDGWHLEWNNPLPAWLAPLAGPLFLLFTVQQTRSAALHRWLLLAFAAATLFFSIGVYPLSIRHLTLIAMLLILLRWRDVERGRALDGAWRLWLAGLALGGMVNVALAAAGPFHPAEAAARVIRVRGLADAHWVSFPLSQGQGVAALNGMTFDDLEQGCAQQFVRWNHHSRIREWRQLTAALRRATDRYGRLYLLSDVRIEGGPAGFYTRIAHVPAGYEGQGFYLYAIRRDLPETRRRAPPCVPGLRPLRLLD